MSMKVINNALPSFTQSSFVPCLSQHAQSGSRTTFGRQVWFTESHIILVIFFAYCFIYSFILDVKGMLLSS
jgi:hypothetical protein